MVILAFLFSIVTALIPALVWLIFFLKEDVHPEPRKLIIYTFTVGALVSIPVLAIQLVFQSLIPSFAESAIILVIGLALIEEVFKFLAAYWSINANPDFDEPIDAMIYMIAAALGFATVENIFIVINTLNVGGSLALGSAISTLSLRFIGATLLHTLTSGLIGYYWAMGRMKKFIIKPVSIGLGIATLIHAAFNFLILRFQDTNLLYPSLFLMLAAFFILNDFEKLKIEEATESK